jgi:WD40 repeat protein
MDLSPDGKYLASSSLDDTVRVWETETAREVYRLPGHGRLGGRRALRFTPDSQRVVSWGDDMRVYVWDVPTGKALIEYRAQPIGLKLPHASETSEPFGGGDGVFHLDAGALSPDASRLLVLGRDSRLFDVFTRQQIGQFERMVGIHGRPAISPDNQFTLALSQGRESPSVRNAATGSTTVQYSVELRKLVDGELVAAIDAGRGGSAAAAFSHDGRKAAISVGNDDPAVLILSVPELNELARIEGLPGRANAVEFSRSGKRLAVSNADTTIVVYDLEKLPKR